MAYIASPEVNVVKYLANLSKPLSEAARASSERMLLPIAVPMTLAFHVRMNMAPLPKRKLKRMQKMRTRRLLKNIFWRVFSFSFATLTVAPPAMVVEGGSFVSSSIDIALALISLMVSP